MPIDTARIRLTPAQAKRLREVVTAGVRVYNGRAYRALATLRSFGFVAMTFRYIDIREQFREWLVRPTEAGRAFLSGQPAVAVPNVSRAGAGTGETTEADRE
jgi:hypothetical protein